MSVSIRRVRVAGFRGIGEPVEIDLEGRGMILMGDNGAGKSSLLEAIEYGLTGGVASLAGRTQRISVKRHAPHVGAARPAEVVLVLEGPGGITQEVGPETTLDTLDEPFRSFVRAARGRQFLLRRAHVLELIEAQDRDRYEALAPFLGVQGFGPVERRLQAVRQKAEERVRTQEGELDVAEGRVAQRVGSAEPDAVWAWLEARAARVGIGLPADLAELPGTLAQRPEPTGQGLAERRVGIERLIEALPTVDKLERLEALLAAARDWDGAETVRYEVVLEQGIRWLWEGDGAQCPLCESRIAREAVVARARDRLREASSAVAARKAADEARQAVLGRLRGITSERARPAGIDEALVTAIERLSGERRALAADVVTQVGAALAGVREQLAAARAALPAVDDGGDAVADLLWAAEAVPAWEAARRHHAVLVAVAARAGRLAAHAVDARRKAAQEVLAATAADVTQIYGAFHEGEAALRVSLEMKEHGSGSAKVLVDVLEQAGEDPRGLLSEGHLDTLGLAMFFALHRHPGHTLGLLMLDDVLGTIDTGHRERVVRWLMREIAPHRQLIVTTHSRQWWEWLIELQRTEGVEDRFRHHEVVRDAGGVASLVDVQTRLERLRAAVEGSADPIQIGQLAGHILEAELREIRIAWRLAVSARPGERYTIGDLWGATNKKLKSGVCAGFVERVGRAREVIDGMKVIRNWATHANDWTDLRRGEVERFAEAVEDLVAAMKCTECGRRLVLQGKAVMCPKSHGAGSYLP